MQIRKGPRDPRADETDEMYDEQSERGLDAIPSFSDEPTRPAWRREPLPTPRAERAVPPLTSEPGAPESIEAAPRATAPASSESTVDAHSSFDGRYETDHDLRVFGKVSGEIVCRGQLTIERDATAKAKIEAREVIARGRIEGEVTCSGKLVVEASAVVTGKVRTATLVVHEGGSLGGTIETTTAAPTAASAAAPKATKREPAAAAEELGDEMAAPARAARTRDLPSFALVSSDERPAPEKAPATAR